MVEMKYELSESISGTLHLSQLRTKFPYGKPNDSRQNKVLMLYYSDNVADNTHFIL